MSLEKRFEKVNSINNGLTLNEVTSQCVQICDEFAIAFYEWRSTSPIKNIDQYTNKELLEIYKQGL